MRRWGDGEGKEGDEGIPLPLVSSVVRSIQNSVHLHLSNII